MSKDIPDLENNVLFKTNLSNSCPKPLKEVAY